MATYAQNAAWDAEHLVGGPCLYRIPTRDGRTLACARSAGHVLAHYPKIGSGQPGPVLSPFVRRALRAELPASDRTNGRG